MLDYEKIIFLKKLSDDLNENNPEDKKEIDRLTNENLQLILSQEKAIEKKSEKINRSSFREFVCQDLAKQDKAKLLDKRYLSEGQLEMTFKKGGEIFSQVYEPDSYIYQKNKKREDKQKQEVRQDVLLQESTAQFRAL